MPNHQVSPFSPKRFCIYGCEHGALPHYVFKISSIVLPTSYNLATSQFRKILKQSVTLKPTSISKTLIALDLIVLIMQCNFHVKFFCYPILGFEMCHWLKSENQKNAAANKNLVSLSLLQVGQCQINNPVDQATRAPELTEILVSKAPSLKAALKYCRFLVILKQSPPQYPTIFFLLFIWQT